MNKIDLLLGSVTSAILLIGKICIAMAVAEGLAAPSSALANTSTIYGTILTTTVYKQPLSIYEIIGLVVGLVGVSVLSIGGIVVSKIRSMIKLTKVKN